MKIVVIGCGNWLTGDDAVGLHVIRELQRQELPLHIKVIEAGTPGIELMDMMEDADKAIIVDAVISGSPIGTVHKFTDKDLPPRNLMPLSLHGFNIIDAIELGGKVQPERMPKEIVIIGIEIPDIREYKIGLSAQVQNKVLEAVKAVLNELEFT